MARILVIDDDGDVRAVVIESLKATGHTVVAAANGAEGLTLQRDQGSDLVITDLIMPEMEGIETIRELRREFPALKIIAMSGGGRSLDARSYLMVARELGADAVLSKPFSESALLEAVANAVGSAQPVKP